LLAGIYQIYFYILLLKRKTLIALGFFVFIAVTNIVLNILLIPQMGIDGAALATFVAYLIQAIGIFFISSREFEVKFPWEFFLKSFLSAGLMFVVLMFFEPQSWSKNLILFIAGMLMYVLFMFLTGALGKREIELIKKIIPN
jgi:O-antigen/teichoic acid export membrane protein